MNLDMALQLVRYALLTIGPVLVTRGLVSDDNWQLIVGAIIGILPWLWGIYVKWGTTSVPDKVAARSDVPTVSPLTGKTVV